MILYPTIELLNGRCVSLNRGRLDEPHIWHVDPVEKALEFAAAGAQWLHVTDFDAVQGSNANEALVTEIIRCAGAPVQLAGGIRTREKAERWIDQGAGRLVVGTLAAQNPGLVKALAKSFPDQIVLAVDVWQGRVMTEGWQTQSAFEPAGFMAAYSDTPLAAFLVTDIDSDIEDTDASLGLISGLANATKTPLIASGLVRALDDISRLKYVRNVAGAIVGRALFRKAFTLEEAMAVVAQAPEPVADFI
ncbi:MAG: 1-(5-phosphoribosyl)-5-[(5-phosphoribosylamino)methylideneamino] imidazole-4-carboxamide isomerase [Rhodobacter sp.]|nr:1-(5-phosphoribosyl)-5-[(5-phosphoribosylamino)methylideneamino] imidazole-4-carboxamide isomerase [Rhodobacter sp.]